MLVNGSKLAGEILAEGKRLTQELGRPVTLSAVVADSSPATESYLRIKKRQAKKAGIEMSIVALSLQATTDELIAAVTKDMSDTLIVQLPLPAAVDRARVLDAIPLAKDADALSTRAHELFDKGDPMAVMPPVVAAIEEILKHANVNPNGKRVAVIGNGWLVGAPAASWFSQVGAEVTILTKDESDFGLLKEADIVVSGAGSPHLIKPSMLKDGIVLIDAGTSESDGAIVGDADPACAEKASVFTPVPGGVGPIAVACLFRNAAILASRSGLRTP